jgi:hypothetical protein
LGTVTTMAMIIIVKRRSRDAGGQAVKPVNKIDGFVMATIHAR